MVSIPERCSGCDVKTGGEWCLGCCPLETYSTAGTTKPGQGVFLKVTHYRTLLKRVLRIEQRVKRLTGRF